MLSNVEKNNPSIFGSKSMPFWRTIVSSNILELSPRNNGITRLFKYTEIMGQ